MSMDDAGNGRRGARAAPTPALLALLRDRYGLPGTDAARDLGGSSNLNLLIPAAGCVARVYRPYVSASRLEAIQQARRVLAEGGVPCAEAVLTRDGASWSVLDGRLVEVERFVEADERMSTPERLAQGLPCLGRIHALLRAVEAGPDGRTPSFANHVEATEALEWTRRGTQRIRAWGPFPAELRLAEAAEELAQQVSDAERETSASLPRQLVHGDFWDNNVLFRAGRLALVADFDFMGHRARIDDLALTLYFACAPFGDDPGGGRIGRVCRLVGAYDAGLDEPLTRAERAALPFALARQPLWAVGRWMALLDDVGTARRLAAELPADVEWALALMREAGQWQAALA
jgi:Ser/Thr protein kinase RdoA (MazF antagonist)